MIEQFATNQKPVIIAITGFHTCGEETLPVNSIRTLRNKSILSLHYYRLNFGNIVIRGGFHQPINDIKG